MVNCEKFCTCTNFTCPLNPRNQEDGCAPCIAKNLRLGEVPSCFFNAIGSKEDERDGDTYASFAREVAKLSEEER